MRLIDADAITRSTELVKKIVVYDFTPYIKADDLIQFIDKLPTAYNVDKVVEQLEEYSSGDVCSRFSGGCPYLNNPDVHCEHCAVMMAIGVVKAGGVE